MARMLNRRTFLGGLAALPALSAFAQNRSLTIASTTSLEQSGLLRVILPAFKAHSGIDVSVYSLASSQAIHTAKQGGIDLVLVNDPEAATRFMEAKDGARREFIMYNEFIIAGPRSDPAGINGLANIAAGLREIARRRAQMVSRGDQSGTHAAEMRFWAAAAVNPKARSGQWYREVGLGMGPALEVANRLQAYILTDRGTYLAHRNRMDLSVLVENDPRGVNEYDLILVNQAKYPAVRSELGNQFIDWILSVDGQNTITSHKIDGEPLFMPAAQRTH